MSLRFGSELWGSGTTGDVRNWSPGAHMGGQQVDRPGIPRAVLLSRGDPRDRAVGSKFKGGSR